MTHQITLKSNPRLLILVILVIGLPVLAIVSLFLIGTLIGIIFLVIAGYISYQLSKFLRNQIDTRIITSDEGITFKLPYNETYRYDWSDVTHAGYCKPAKADKQRPYLYIYNADDDKLMTVPAEYSDFDMLLETIRDNIQVGFEDHNLKQGVSINDMLKAKIEQGQEERTYEESEAEET